MNKKYVAPAITDNSIYLINGIADINLGSRVDGDITPPDNPDDPIIGGAKERESFGPDANYGNIW